MCLDAIQIERPGKECEHMNFERKSKFLLEKAGTIYLMLELVQSLRI